MCDVDSLATSHAHTGAVLSVAKAAENLNRSYDKKRKVDSMHKSVDAYIRLGMVDKAKAVLEEIDMMNHEEECNKVMEDGAMPENIQIGDSVGGDDPGDAEVENELNLGPFKSVCEDPLDDGDDGSDTDEEAKVRNPRSSERTETEDDGDDDDDGLSQASSTASGKERIREATNKTKV